MEIFTISSLTVTYVTSVKKLKLEKVVYPSGSVFYQKIVVYTLNFQANWWKYHELCNDNGN